MNRRSIYITILLIFICRLLPFAQSAKPDITQITKYLDAIKKSKVYAYKYTISAKYPNGQSDKVNGEVYANNEQKFMFNTCEAFTMIYSDKWFYKADHQSKEIAVININTQLDKKYKSQLEEGVFNNTSAGLFIDSVLVKQISGIRKTQHSDTTSIEIDMLKGSFIQAIKIVYDEKHNLLAGYSMTTYQAWPTNEFGKGKGTLRVIEYKSETIKNDDRFNVDNYFIVNGDKVQLKKNVTYKLSAKL